MHNQLIQSKLKSLTARQRLHLLEKDVFRKRPVLKHIYNDYGTMSLLEFTKLQLDLPSNNYLPQERKAEAIKAISETAGKLLGDTKQKSVAEQLVETYAVITSDHHGPITDPGFFNSNLLFNYASQATHKQENIIILSCANISFDNDSFPRGHLFHSQNGGETITNQLVFFPRKVRPMPVFGHVAYTEEQVLNARKRIEDLYATGVIKESQKESLLQVIKNIYADRNVLAQTTFSEQVTLTNYALWKTLFQNDSKAPNLIYLEQESLVNKLITTYHLKKNTLIKRILLDETYHKLIIKHFDTLPGGFSTEQKTGTFLFWAVPNNQKYRVQLWKQGNELVSTDGAYHLPLTADAIAQALENKELIPSTLLSFIILSFYYGLTLFGGGGQTTYLTRMKKAYKKFLKELDLSDEDTRLSDHVSTIQQCIPYPSLAFFTSENKQAIPATPLDMILSGMPESLKTIQEMAQTITVKQAFARAFPQMLHETESLQAADIDVITGFDTQSKTCGTLSL